MAIANDLNPEIVLTWGEPTADQNGGPLTGLEAYIISRSEGTAAALVIIDTVEATQTQYTDIGLKSATTYFYAVTAFDLDDNVSPRSNIASALTPGIIPPVGLDVVARINAIDVSWNDSVDPDLIGYNVYRSTRPDTDYERLVVDAGLGFTTGLTTYIDDPLAGGDTYYYRISAVTTVGESNLTAFKGATVIVDNRAPGPPSFIEGDPVLGSPNDLVVSWNAPATDFNGALLTGVASYQIYRADASVGPFDLVGSSAINSFTDMNLLTQTTYFYQVEAIDAAGNVGPRSAVVALATGGVDIPKNLALSVFVPGNPANPPVVTITWDPSAGAILDYEVQRTTVAFSTQDSDYITIQPTDDSTTRLDDTGTRGQIYYYRVRARDIDNNRSSWTPIRVVSIPNP